MSTPTALSLELPVLRNARDLVGHKLRARDGLIGEVRDLLFDDQHWRLRYFVVETGSFLNRGRVLIAPEAVHAPEWSAHILPVDLTQDQVRHSPPVEADRPVTRHQEMTLREYYGWPVYWVTGFLGPNFMPPPPVPTPTEKAHLPPADPHLHGTQDVAGYALKATDGEIGHVTDFLIDDHAWNIRYLVIDTNRWLPGRKVLVSPWWITEVRWTEAEVRIDLAKETIRQSPPYDHSRALTVDDQGRLHDYYGRPRHVNRRQWTVPMVIESPAFGYGDRIPEKYTQFGESRQPPLVLNGVPPEAVSLALVMDDPDAANGTFTHWIIYNLNPQLTKLVDGATPDDAQLGLNSAGRVGYIGPKPPRGEHRYFFRLYALDAVLDLPENADRDTLYQAMADHILADAVWMGRVAAKK